MKAAVDGGDLNLLVSRETHRDLGLEKEEQLLLDRQIVLAAESARGVGVSVVSSCDPLLRRVICGRAGLTVTWTLSSRPSRSSTLAEACSLGSRAAVELSVCSASRSMSWMRVKFAGDQVIPFESGFGDFVEAGAGQHGSRIASAQRQAIERCRFGIRVQCERVRLLQAELRDLDLDRPGAASAMGMVATRSSGFRRFPGERERVARRM